MAAFSQRFAKGRCSSVWIDGERQRREAIRRQVTYGICTADRGSGSPRRLAPATSPISPAFYASR